MSRAMIFLVIQLAAFWPVWGWYIARLTDSSDEPWGILALITALFFVAGRGHGQELKAAHLGLSSIFTLAYALTFPVVPPLARAVLAVLAIGCTLSPARLGRSMHIGIIGLLLLSLPIIASLQFFLGYPVRLLTAIISAKLVGLTGYDVAAQGTCLYWMGEVISVDAPCSGIRMLWSGLYLNFTLACFTGLDTFKTWLTYVFSVFAIFLGNTIRASALFFTETGIIEAPSWAHQGTGVVIFALVATAIVAFNRHVNIRREVLCHDC